MLFRTTCVTKSLHLQETDLQEFPVTVGSRSIRLKMESCPKTDLPAGVKVASKCTAVVSVDAARDQLLAFREAGVKGDKTVKVFLDGIAADLLAALRRTIYDYRWRHALIATHNPIIHHSSLSWSEDGMAWEYAYPLPQLELQVKFGFMMQQNTPETFQSLEQLVNNGIDEPTGHELYNEAYELKDSNPRSALVIGIAALETGVKECASFLVPQAEWLINNVPSPPLVKLLTHAVPQLPAVHTIQGKVLAPPKTIVKRIDEAVKIRNKIAHGQLGAVKSTDLWEFLRAARDVLYLLDYYRGYSWAWENIGQDTKGDLLTMAGKSST